MALTLLAPQGSPINDLDQVQEILRQQLGITSLKVVGSSLDTRKGIIFTVNNVHVAANGVIGGSKMKLQDLPAALGSDLLLETDTLAQTTDKTPEGETETLTQKTNEAPSFEFSIVIPDGITAEKAIRTLVAGFADPGIDIQPFVLKIARSARANYRNHSGQLTLSFPEVQEGSSVNIVGKTVPIGDLYAMINEVGFRAA